MRLTFALVVVLAALAAAPSAYACACCAEKNAWFEYSDRLDTREVSRLMFGGLARVYPDTERIDGINDPFPSYELVVKKSGRSWKFLLGSAGSLSFTLPARAEQFGVDIHDGKQGGGGGPLLYKELRLRGTATGTGDFKGGAYTLVLMGRGNFCLAAESFTRWRLELAGKKVDYTLYGTLAKPSG